MRNKGIVSFNQCKLVSNKEYEPYIESDKIVNIAGGEISDLQFIIRAMDRGISDIVLSVECLDNVSAIVPLSLEILSPELDISFNGISFEKKFMVVNYNIAPTFSDFERVSFSLSDSKEFLLLEKTYGLELIPGEEYNGEAFIELEGVNGGLLKLSISKGGKLLLEENVIYDSSSLTGFSIFSVKGSGSIVLVIVLATLVSLFFIIRRILYLRKDYILGINKHRLGF